MKKLYKKEMAIALACASVLNGKTSAMNINKCQNSKMVTSVKQNGRFLNWWENRSNIQKLGILGSVGIVTLATVLTTTACLLKSKNNKDSEGNIPENNKGNDEIISYTKNDNNNLINNSLSNNKSANLNLKKENNEKSKQNNRSIFDNKPKNMQEKLNWNLDEDNKINIINKQQEPKKSRKKVDENILKIMNEKISSCIEKQKKKATEDTHIYDSVGDKKYSELVKIVAEMIINGCLENKFEKLELTDKQVMTKAEDCKPYLDIILKYFADIFNNKINLDAECIKFSYKGGCTFTFKVPGDQENKLTLVIKDGSRLSNYNDGMFSAYFGDDRGSFLVELSSTLLTSAKNINYIRFRIGPKSMAEWKV